MLPACIYGHDGHAGLGEHGPFVKKSGKNENLPQRAAVVGRRVQANTVRKEIWSTSCENIRFLNVSRGTKAAQDGGHHPIETSFLSLMIQELG